MLRRERRRDATQALVALLWLLCAAPWAHAQEPPREQAPRYHQLRAEARRADLLRGSDPSGYELALIPLLAAWEEYTARDPADPALDLDTRLTAFEVARVMSRMEPEFRPPGLQTLDALRLAAAMLEPTTPYLRFDRASVEADLIEELIAANQLTDGIEHCRRARDEFADVPQLLAEMVLMEANALQLLGTYREALESVHEGRARLEGLRADQVASDYAWTYARTIEAQILIDMGLPDRARPLLDECLSDLEATGDRSNEGLILDLLVSLAQARGDYRWIIENLPPRLEGAGVFGDTSRARLERLAEVENARAGLALDSGEALEAARDRLVPLAAELGMDSLAGVRVALTLCGLDLALEDVGAAQNRLAWIREALERAEDASHLFARRELAELAGRVALLHKDDRAALQAARVDLRDAFSSQLRAWSTIPPREGGVGFLLFDGRRSLLATLMRLELALDGQTQGAIKCLELLIDTEARGSLADLLDAARPTQDLVLRQVVPESGGLLVYVPTNTGSLVLTVDSNGPQVWDLPDSERWKVVREQLALAVRAKTASNDESLGRVVALAEGLRDKILPDQLDERVSGWDEVVLVGAGSLGWIPFETLPLRGRGGTPLGLELAISYLPSLTVGLALLERRDGREWRDDTDQARVLVTVGQALADGRGSQTAPLPWRNEYGSLLAGDWSLDQIEIEFRPAEARAAVLESGRRSLALLEVFAHGRGDPSRERSQGLGFDLEHSLFPDDLDQASCPPIVALGVCGAGLGRQRSGDDGVSHLGGSLLAAGAETVLLSSQDLYFEATLELLEVFNREVSKGATPARAMLAARRHVARVPGWEHPAYHSMLHVVGLGNTPLPSNLIATRRGWYSGRLWMVGLLAGATLVGLLIRTRKPAKRNPRIDLDVRDAP